MTCLVNELLRTYSLKLGSICQSVRPSVRSALETHRAHGPSGPVRSAFEPLPSLALHRPFAETRGRADLNTLPSQRLLATCTATTSWSKLQHSFFLPQHLAIRPKKLQTGHFLSLLVPDYVHVQFVQSVNPAQLFIIYWT